MSFIEYENVNEIKQLIKDNYYKNIPDSLVSLDWVNFNKHLDPYTRVLDSVELVKFNNSFMSRKDGVVGITLDSTEMGYEILETPNGGNAYSMGVIRGDIIKKVNGKIPNTFQELNSLIETKNNNEIHLDILRNKKIIKIHLKKETLIYKNVFSQKLGKTAIISIEQFNYLSSIEFLINSISLQPNSIDTLIIDLRNNPGGSLYECLDIADQFFNDGTILVKRKSVRDSLFDYSKEDGKWIDVKNIIVLQNSNSASASELLSGILKFGRNAKVVGEKSYGKGLVQTRMNIGNTVLYVTTYEYFPLGYVKVNGLGIIPDRRVTTPLKVGKLPDNFNVKRFRELYPIPSREALSSNLLKGRRGVSHFLWDKDGELFEILLQKSY